MQLELRYCFASLLIAQGLNVVLASLQLGHASPSITLSVYAHLFDQAEHAPKASAQLEADNSVGGCQYSAMLLVVSLH